MRKDVWIPCRVRPISHWYSKNQSENSGEVADESVNVFQAQATGESLIQGIAGTSAFDYKFRKKDSNYHKDQCLCQYWR